MEFQSLKWGTGKKIGRDGRKDMINQDIIRNLVY